MVTRTRWWVRQWLPQRHFNAALSEYHDEGMPLYDVEIVWTWRGRVLHRSEHVANV